MEFSALLPPAQQGVSPSLFSVSKHKDKTKLMLQNKHLKKNFSRERGKKEIFMQVWILCSKTETFSLC